MNEWFRSLIEPTSQQQYVIDMNPDESSRAYLTEIVMEANRQALYDSVWMFVIAFAVTCFAIRIVRALEKKQV